jgi:DUF971 family protein
VRITWDDGRTEILAAEFLRVLTPSAERTGHGTRTVIGGKAGVRLVRIEPVGRYAVRIVFDDGHASGLYTFAALRRLAEDRERLWAEYLAELAAVSLDRDRPGTAPAPRQGTVPG